MLLHQVGEGRLPGVFEKGSDVHWAVNREKPAVCNGLWSGKRSHQETGDEATRPDSVVVRGQRERPSH